MRPLSNAVLGTNKQMHALKQQRLSSNGSCTSRHPTVTKHHSCAVLKARRRQHVSIQALKQSSEGVMLPMDAYRVLGVNRAASRETCIKASEELLGNVPDVGYSQDLILSRALALEATTSVLLDYSARRAYDRSPQIEVAYTDMPGAFALMQEAGDVQPVIKWGRAWLEDNSFDGRAKDVALTAALAHCDLAAYWLEELGKDRVQDASGLLGKALELLRQYKAAPALQLEVQGAYEELQAQVALQQIALPLHEAETRAKGFATLPGLLWAEDGTPVESFPRLNMNRAAFIDELCRQATPAEMVALYSNVRLLDNTTPQERHILGLAGIAEAAASQKPAAVTMALRFLQGYQADPGAEDASVEIAICQCLLGRTSEALATLGVLEGSVDSNDSAPDSGILEFLQGNAAEDGDMTPGLIAMAQSWVEDVALPSFRGSGGSMPLLNNWFESPQVKLYLMSRGVVHGAWGGVMGAAKGVPRSVGHAGKSAIAGAQAVLSFVSQALQERPQQQQLSEEQAGDMQPALAASKGAAVARTMLPDLAVLDKRLLQPAMAHHSSSHRSNASAAVEQETCQGSDSSYRSSGKLMRAVATTTIERPPAAPQKAEEAAPLATKQSVGALMKRYSEEGTPAATLASSAPTNGRSTASLAAPTLTAAAPMSGPDSIDGMVEAWGAASNVPPVRESIGAGIIPLEIEREMWQSFASVRRQRSLRLVKAATALTAIGIAVLAWKKPEALRPSNIATVVTAPGRAAVGWVQETLIPPGVPLPVEDARSLVLQWQATKAQALGSSHDVVSLEDILGDRMLQAWKQRGMALQKDDRHWSYNLKDVSIDRVETSRDGKRALVEATLTEAGSLLASDGAVIDAYQAAFTQEYEMRLMRNKGWRLVASKLIF